MIGLLLVLAGVTGPAPSVDTSVLSFGRFGRVSVYEPARPPTSVALFFSGDGGWNAGVVDMARAMAQHGSLVLGIDTPRYLAAIDRNGGPCASLAVDAEALSQYGQKVLGLPAYRPPLLVGYSSGAGLSYATLAQAPANTFEGSLSLGFDPALPLRTDLCAGGDIHTRPSANGRGRVLLPVDHLTARWIVLQGNDDQVWPADSAAAFVDRVTGAELVRLPRVGHGFGVQSAWLPQFTDAVARLAPAPSAPPPPELGDLPVVGLPMPASPRDYFAIVLSGDGGWASIDKEIGEELVKAGVPTVGFNSLQYFWHRRTADEAAGALARLIRHYQQAFGRTGVIVVGYSRGADVLPIMLSRLPAGLLDQVKLAAFLGLEHETSLEFRVGDWVGSRAEGATRLLPEVERLAGHPLLCIYGAREGDTLCPDLPAGLADVVRLEGGHHFDGDYHALARLVLDRVK
jgi:type IV secretory pathway VirJ component